MERIYDLKEVNRIMREDLAKEFPKFKFSVVKDRNTIDLSIVEMPYNPFEDGLAATRVYRYNRHWDRLDNLEGNRAISKKALEDFKRIAKIANKHNWDNSDPMTDYFDVNFYLNIYIGKPSKYGTDEPLKVVSYQRSNNMPNTPNRANKPNNGTAIRSCAGWTIYELSVNGKTVFNARKDKETDKNTADWDAIKGEIFVNTGFKWGRFGAFEKWGGVSLETIDKLCEILSKYYKSSKPDAPQDAKPDNAPEPRKPFTYGELFNVPSDYGTELIGLLRTSYNFDIVKPSVNGTELDIMMDSVGLLVRVTDVTSGSFLIGDITDDEAKSNYFSHASKINYKDKTPVELAQKITDWYTDYAIRKGKLPDSRPKKAHEYVYGDLSGIPAPFGDELIRRLRDFGFDVYTADYRNENSIIIKINIPKYDLIGGFYDAGLYGLITGETSMEADAAILNAVKINYSQVTPLELAQQIRAWYIEYAEKHGKAPKEDGGKKREFVYGANDGIPESAGDELLEALRGFGFSVIASSGNLFFMSKPNSQLGLDVVENETDKSITIGSNIYSKDYRLSIPYFGITPYQLARKIENVYNDYLKKTQDAQEDNEAAQKKEKAQKAIAALEIIVNGNFTDEVKERTRKAIAALNLIIKK